MKSDATVYLVDDERELLDSLGHLLRMEGFSVELYESPCRFLMDHDPSRPGCVVLDLAMEEMDGLLLQGELLGQCESRQVIFLSGRATVPDSVAAMKAGAVDFLTKPFEGTALVAAVTRAIERDRENRRRGARVEDLRKRFASLTQRECDVLGLVTAGRMNKEIAEVLGIAERTVKFHRSHLMRKLRVASVVDLAHLTHELRDAP